MTPTVPSARSSRQEVRLPDLTVTVRRPAVITAPAPRHLVPNLLIAGVTHSGAGDLAQELARHAQVKLPVAKRIDHYTAMRYGRRHEVPVSDYDRYFASWKGQRYRLENSPVYFDGGRALVRAVDRDLPGVRVLLLLRDPAERLWASFRDKVAGGRLPRAMTYETFVERCLALRANGCDRFEGNRHFRSMSSGFYVEFLDHWLDVFDSRVKVVFAEDVEADPQPVLAGLFDWLDLDAADVAAPDGDLPDRASALESFETDPQRRTWRERLIGAPLRAAARPTPPRVPRQADRVRARVETLYGGANRELAAVLRSRGCSALPEWLTR